LVIIGGLAELVSGSLSMGLGAYLAAVTEADHYKSEENREMLELQEKPTEEEEEIYTIMGCYGVDREATKPVVEALKLNHQNFVQVKSLFNIIAYRLRGQ
jgi:vacuolar iron transporter family protein